MNSKTRERILKANGILKIITNIAVGITIVLILIALCTDRFHDMRTYTTHMNIIITNTIALVLSWRIGGSIVKALARASIYMAIKNEHAAIESQAMKIERDGNHEQSKKIIESMNEYIKSGFTPSLRSLCEAVSHVMVLLLFL